VPQTTEPPLLFVDDEVLSARAVVSALKRRNSALAVLITNSANEALLLAQQHQVEVAIIDLSLDEARGPESGLELLDQLAALDPTIRVLVLTGHSGTDFGIRALQRGAASFIEKPASADHLYALIKDAQLFSQLQRRDRALLKDEQPRLGTLTSRAPSMKSALERAAYAASTSQPVLLIGETGTGKGVLAQAIHCASRRRGGFYRCQPSFGNADLVASELFGHQKGAFTGANENRPGILEEANGGTVFLDEVDEIPTETQVILLNALQDRNFRRLGSSRLIHSDFRLISAMNCSMKEALGNKKLRQDFFHRIAHVTIEIPPLRERLEDLPLLAQGFIDQLAVREKLPVRSLTDRALTRLSRYRFPGNVRELQARLENGAFMANYRGQRQIDLDDLELPAGKAATDGEGTSFRDRVERFELQLVLEALARKDNNQTRAAESLQLDRTSLRRILIRHDKL